MRYLVLLLLVVACSFTPRPAFTPSESKELVKVCWSPTIGIAQIPSSCDKPEAIVWPSAPLVVYANTNMYLRTLHAIGVWNTELGFEMFVLKPFLAAPLAQADVLVVQGGVHRRWLGVTSWRKRPVSKALQSIVVIFSAGGPDTLVHELGHAIGLAHDPDDFRSIMYPNNSRPLPKIQTQDLAVLRRLYGQ